jgi:hypothetical protein
MINLLVPIVDNLCEKEYNVGDEKRIILKT